MATITQPFHSVNSLLITHSITIDHVGYNVRYLLSIGLMKPLEIIVNSLFCVCLFLSAYFHAVKIGWIIP